MALRITTSKETSKGVTTEFYQFIDSITVAKDGKVKVHPRYYQSQSERLEDEHDVVQVLATPGFLKMFYFEGKAVDYSIADAYNDIATLQKAEGHVVESDETGSWVVV
jgi:hypothetical protein